MFNYSLINIKYDEISYSLIISNKCKIKPNDHFIQWLRKVIDLMSSMELNPLLPDGNIYSRSAKILILI